MKSFKLLYCSADHISLEWETLSLFSEMGIEVFSTGLYLDPQNPNTEQTKKGPLNFKVDPLLIEEFKQLNPNRKVHTRINLSRKFVDKFDLVFMDHCCPYPFYVFDNWTIIKHKPTVWRTYSQQSSQVELITQQFRQQGLKIVRFSPKERTIPNYAGDDAVIRSPMNPNEYSNWTGKDKTVITFNNFFEKRSYVSNTPLYLKIRNEFPDIFHLYGAYNEDCKLSEGFLSDKEQKEKYRSAGIYFALGSKPASLTYNFMEALLTGTPVITWGSQLGNSIDNSDWKNTYEVPDLFENGTHCMYSDNPKELIEYITLLLKDRQFAEKISKQGREKAISIWDKNTVIKQWEDFFGSIKW